MGGNYGLRQPWPVAADLVGQVGPAGDQLLAAGYEAELCCVQCAMCHDGGMGSGSGLSLLVGLFAGVLTHQFARNLNHCHLGHRLSGGSKEGASQTARLKQGGLPSDMP